MDWFLHHRDLHHERVNHEDSQRISKLQHCEDQCNWNLFDIPLVMEKMDKFYKNNPGTTVNVIFSSKKNIYTARRSELTKSTYIDDSRQGK